MPAPSSAALRKGAAGRLQRDRQPKWAEAVLPDSATVSAAVQNGEVDWRELPLPDLIPALRRDRNLVVEVVGLWDGRLAMFQPIFTGPSTTDGIST
jgi:hypothetical protein